MGVLALALPKMLFARFYHQPAWYEWVSEPSLAVAIFITIAWWCDARTGRLPETSAPPLSRWALLFLSPPTPSTR